MTDPILVTVSYKVPFAASRNFSIPAIASLLNTDAATAWGPQRTRRVSKDTWQDIAESLSIEPVDPIYLATQALFADHRNQLRVPEWCVWIRRDTPVPQVWTFTVGGNTAGDYRLLVDGVVVASVTANGVDLAADIRDDLVAAFNLGTSPQTAAAAANPTGTITADEPGVSFLVTTESPGNVLTASQTTPNTGIAQDMASAIGPSGDDSFYMWTEASLSDGVNLNAAAFTQTAARRLLFLGQSNTTAITQNVTTDAFSRMKALGYGRSSGWYHPRDTEYLAAGVIGRCLPLPVGQINWAHRQIATVTPEAYALLPGVANILEGKNVNYYDALELGSTLYGTMADGLYLDQAKLRDVIESGLRSRTTQLLQNNDYVAFDDTKNGAGQVASVVLAYGRELERQGALVVGSSAVTVGKVDDIPEADKKVRNWPEMKLYAEHRNPINQIRPLAVTIQL